VIIGNGHQIQVAGEDCVADTSGALYLAQTRTLVVSDLHLEKGSSFARRGMMIPPYDTVATLMRLKRVIDHYDPACVIALGDSFHDREAAERLADEDREKISSLQKNRDWIWISGNHDPAPPQNLAGETREEIRIGALVLRHEPVQGEAEGEVAGHLHPVARVVTPRGSLRRRCFVSDGARCILPAFGAYAGGLNLRDKAFAPLFPARHPQAHVLGRDRIYSVAHENCYGD
jgi:DNA ligase-associated metallophosphoesterase